MVARPITEMSARNLVVITLSVRRLMRISNEDCSTARIHSCDTAPTPTGFAEVVSDDFPVIRAPIVPLLISTQQRQSDGNARASGRVRRTVSVTLVKQKAATR